MFEEALLVGEEQKGVLDDSIGVGPAQFEFLLYLLGNGESGHPLLFFITNLIVLAQYHKSVAII